jgi:hypothetical protein
MARQAHLAAQQRIAVPEDVSLSLYRQKQQGAAHRHGAAGPPGRPAAARRPRGRLALTLDKNSRERLIDMARQAHLTAQQRLAAPEDVSLSL